MVYRIFPLLLLLVTVLRSSSSLVQAWRYGDDSSSTPGDDNSEDGGSIVLQSGRLGGISTGTNRASACEQCTNIGGWRCDNLNDKNTPWCYQSSNRKLKKWIRKGFCLQKCAELGMPHPAHRNCCTSTQEVEEDDSNGTSDNNANGNDSGNSESTPRADTCVECTDKLSSGMAKRGMTCRDITDLGKRCMRYQRWVSQGWVDWDLCRKTCSDIGHPYPDQTCCGNEEEEENVVEDSDCTPCSDEVTPWMQGRGVTCETWPELRYRCNANHWQRNYWVKNKFCRNSCYALGQEYMYPGDNCCVNRGDDGDGDGNGNGNGGVNGIPAPNPVNECLSDPCENGSCIDLTGGYRCDCQPGWTGTNCDQDIDECLTNNGGCHPNAKCTNIQGGRTCSCTSGYFGDGINCSDRDECSNNPCDPNASCMNTEGSFECRCNEGFAGDGIDQCRQIDDCESAPCANGSCIDLTDDYRCDCLPGWAGRNCDENNDDCSPNPCANGQCIDKVNGYSCSCEEGWRGGDCDIDIDECEDDPCNEDAVCTNQDGGFRCQCRPGYIGDGINECLEVDECKNDPCDENAVCTNTAGSFECQCTDGYEGNGIICSDIDECSKGTDDCHSDAICTNLDGSYRCNCKSGFTGDGTSCIRDTKSPTTSPSATPSKDPTASPTDDPTSSPTDAPSTSPSCSTECVQCENNPSTFMLENAPNAPKFCEGENVWGFLGTICLETKDNPFIVNKYCQQACWDLGQRGYVNECGEPEECCPIPTPSPTEAAACLDCSNERTSYMVNNGIVCETWAVNDFDAKCSGTFQKDNNGNLRTQPFCRLSCYDRKSIIFEDAGGLPCCKPSPRPCIQCEDRRTTYMENRGFTCDTWNYITKERCDDPDSTFQVNNACRQFCSEMFNSIFYHEPCCKR